jgi:50S ribosomal protein L16 3-hydroxylase
MNANTPLPLLGGLTISEFLRDYWQKRPLLVRNALPNFVMPLSPEELGGLALEEGVEARIVLEKGGKTAWELRRAPFSEEDFTTLPATHWTLLVQEINKHIPEFALLQDEFNFLPNWRLDDVMVSYAPDQGTVGPHADNYDVFLFQGLGQRRWQLSNQPCGVDALLPDLPLRILKDFRPEEEMILQQGDMLYLPPGVVHHGVALGDCMTISVGYRAPTEVDLIAGYIADRLADIDPERFYSDNDLKPQSDPGLIADEALAKVRQILLAAIDEQAIDRWFGQYITDLRPGHTIPLPEEEMSADEIVIAIRQWGDIWRSEYCRFAWRPAADGATLYVAGEIIPLPPPLTFAARLICSQRVFNAEELQPHFAIDGFAQLLAQLYALGALYFPDIDED